MLPRIFRIILLTCVLSPAMTASAFAGAEKDYPAFNFAITPADGWNDVTQEFFKPGLCAAFGARGMMEAFIITREDTDPSPVEIDDRFADQYEQFMEKSGYGKRLSSRFVFVQGIKSYERTSAPVVKGKQTSALSLTIPVKGHFYLLRGQIWGGRDAGQDSEIRAMMESFRFLTPPAPVIIDPDFAKKEAARAAYSDAYRRCQKFGEGLGILVVIGAVVGLIIFLSTRKPKSYRRRMRPLAPPMHSMPPLPPPLPPDRSNGSATPPSGPPPLPRSSAIRPRQRHLRG